MTPHRVENPSITPAIYHSALDIAMLPGNEHVLAMARENAVNLNARLQAEIARGADAADALYGLLMRMFDASDVVVLMHPVTPRDFRPEAKLQLILAKGSLKLHAMRSQGGRHQFVKTCLYLTQADLCWKLAHEAGDLGPLGDSPIRLGPPAAA